MEAGLSREVATSLESYIVQRGGNELLAKLKHDVRLMENQDVQKGIENLEQLFQYCQALRVPAEVSAWKFLEFRLIIILIILL